MNEQLTEHEAREEYIKNCRMMIEINQAKVKETEEKIRLARKLNAQNKLEKFQMELDGWVAWVKRWETGLADATGDAG